MDHALSKSKDEELHRVATTKAQAVAKKKHKDSLFKLVEADKERKSVEVALASTEKQVMDQQGQLRNVEEQLVLAQAKIKIQQKELEGKGVEIAKAKQAAYDLGQRKTKEILKSQIREVCHGYYLQV